MVGVKVDFLMGRSATEFILSLALALLYVIAGSSPQPEVLSQFHWCLRVLNTRLRLLELNWNWMRDGGMNK